WRRGGCDGGEIVMLSFVGQNLSRPWNKGLLVGQTKPLQPKHVWSIRVRLEISRKWRDLALFNLAIDSKLNPKNYGWKLRFRRSQLWSAGDVPQTAPE